jgi:NADPH-dependent 2,4-dienoyl-CoA reductase/sulfur reductase-like enzyme
MGGARPALHWRACPGACLAARRPPSIGIVTCVAMAVSLRDQGLRPLLIDKDEVAASWRGRYDRLKLNTGRQFSHLPNRPYPKGTPTFPSRDQVVAYFDEHAREAGIELRLGTEVNRIDRLDGAWLLQTSTGDIVARQVMVATGQQHTPVMPDWPGVFAVDLLHSSAYRNPAGYHGKRVLVVGAGSSGMEIAHDLATGGAEKVWLAVRTPPNIMLRSCPMGCRRTGSRCRCITRRCGSPTESAASRDEPTSATSVNLGCRFPMKVCSRAPAVESFDGDKVVLADGSRVDPDAVVAATGYRRDLTPMVGDLDVLDGDGRPLAAGETAAAEGLRFFGYLSGPR